MSPSFYSGLSASDSGQTSGSVMCGNSGEERARERKPLPRDEEKMTMHLSQINISGLRAATDENRQRSRRLIWVFLLTLCFGVMVAQITDRVRHFLSEPVAVQVRVARNSSLTYPAITICNKVSLEVC